SNLPASQQVPPGVPHAVPTVGDFLAIVGNESARNLVLSIERSAAGLTPALKTQSLIVPGCGELLPHTRRSDHASFWDVEYPAFMLTDTPNMRIPHSKGATVTNEIVVIKLVENVVDVVTAVIVRLAGAKHGEP